MKTKKTSLILILTVVGLLLSNAEIFPQQTADQLYEKALYLEEARGELQEAIDLYNQIVEKQDADQSLQAKALLHVGLCYEKLGMQEAIKAYQRLVSNYPGQKSEVAIASERLSRLIQIADKVSETPVTPEFTKINIQTRLFWDVKLSPDGKTLALASEKKLWVMPLSGNLGPNFPGAPVQLNTKGIEVEGSGISWSDDGKWIAFNEYPKRDEQRRIVENQSIYLVPSGGGNPKKIIENYRDARVVNYRISLSPNGKTLAFSSVEDNKQHIFAISTETGNPIQLSDMQAREPVFSPDGKMIAFVEDKDLGAGEGDLGLWIIPANGGTPHQVADANMASSPVWSPDGSMIAFLDYTRNKKIFIVRVDKTGHVIGNPVSIDAPEGTEGVNLLAGWTPDNKIGTLIRSKEEDALYTLPSQGGQATMVLYECDAMQPRWSPDGKQIFYTTPPKEGIERYYRLGLASVSARGGSGKPLPKDPEDKIISTLAFQGGNRVSPDGKWIISAAVTPADTGYEMHFPRTKILKIAVDGSESTQITNKQGPYADYCPSWSPDGKKVAFVRVNIKDEWEPFGSEAGIYIISSSGGGSTLLTSVSGKFINSPVWSPDGTMIAFLTSEHDPTRSDPTMNVINVNTGESRVIGEVPAAHVNIELVWSPDSKRIAFNDGEGKVIKVMSIADGSIEDIETNLVDVSIYHLDWSPDGEQFVFGGGKGGYYEFWFLEDFLPLVKK